MKPVAKLLICFLLCGCNGSHHQKVPPEDARQTSTTASFKAPKADPISRQAGLDAGWNELLASSPSEVSPWLDYARAYSRGEKPSADHLAVVWERIADRFPNNSDAVLQSVRALRRVGQTSRALARLDQEKINRLDPVELADLYLEVGDYQQAAYVLEKNGLATPAGYQPGVDKMFQEVLSQTSNDSEQWAHNIQLATVTFAFVENWSLANELADLYLDRVARIRRMADLRIMSRLAPKEPYVAKAIQDTRDLSIPFAAIATAKKTKPTFADDEQKSDWQTYHRHCGQCHGDNGDSLGSASRYLYPPARNFAAESLRYISNLNRQATDRDIRQTIREGLLGTAMPAFKQLSEADLERLVRQIRRFQKSEMATAKPESALPQDWSIDASEQVAEGQSQFVRFGCANCHRESLVQEQRVFVDSLGNTIRARDFPTEPLRRGNDPQEIYHRIVTGMPGTPHPQLTSSAADLRPLVLFVRSILPANYLDSTNHSRRQAASASR